jgi:CubicO group peptidase (beta-lactamase class C family)
LSATPATPICSQWVFKDWKVPGASVAIVRGDQVFLAKGYGYRDLEQKKPATEKNR